MYSLSVMFFFCFFSSPFLEEYFPVARQSQAISWPSSISNEFKAKFLFPHSRLYNSLQIVASGMSCVCVSLSLDLLYEY